VSGPIVHRNALEGSYDVVVHGPRQGSTARRTTAGPPEDRDVIAVMETKRPDRRPGAVLDAVTVIALMTPSNTHHKAALAVLHELAGTLKVMHPINMAEVLVKPAGDGTAERVQAELTRAGIVTFTTSPAEPLALARARAATRLKLPDVCAYVTALARGLPLVTFDRQLTIAARAAGIEVLGAPPEWRS
jgi:predicted nucleic acid-binding protein